MRLCRLTIRAHMSTNTKSDGASQMSVQAELARGLSNPTASLNEAFEETADAGYWLSTHRYYRAFIQQNLFGQWELIKVWGGRQSRLGGMQVVPVDNSREGRKELGKEARRRISRGYVRMA